jgi:hypothetical protein
MMRRPAVAAAGQTVARVMGKGNTPIPSPTLVSSIDSLFIQPLHAGAISLALNTPAEAFPTSGIRNLTFDKSVAQGLGYPGKRDNAANRGRQ